MRRILDQRLGFASFKAQRGWARYSLDVIEPEIDREHRDRKRRDHDAALQDEYARRSSVPVDSARRPPLHTRQESLHHPYPPGSSLFDAMLTPTLSALPGGMSPSPEPTSAPAYRGHAPPQGSVHGPPSAKRARLDGPGHPPPPHKQSLMPTSAMKHRRAPSAASSHVTWSHDIPSPGHPPHSAPIYRPISSSDPHFARSATEFVDAATALTSFTRATSTAPTEAEAPVNGEERESAAELMLFLAASPSPPRTKRAASTTSDVADFGGPMPGMLGRRLFGDDEAGSASEGTTPVMTRPDSPSATTEPTSLSLSQQSQPAGEPPRSAPAKMRYRSPAELARPPVPPTPPPPVAHPAYVPPHSAAPIPYPHTASYAVEAPRPRRGSSAGLGSAFDFDAFMHASPSRSAAPAAASTHATAAW
jgi:hypothetical protein